MVYIPPDQTFIYALIDPRDDAIRYVGMTIDTTRRLTGHQYAANHPMDDSPRALWIQALREERLAPILEVLETTTREEAGEAERRWIHDLSREGYDLFNNRKPDSRRGGSRHGSGRKPKAEGEKKLCRRLYLTDAQWRIVREYVKTVVEETN